jgi:membrane-bound serine protease (ClpP class)
LLPHLPFFRDLFQPAPAALSATGASTQFGVASSAALPVLGRTGRAATTLRPSGVMESGSDRLDVVTDGEFLEAGTPLRVVQVDGNRIVVARDEAAATRTAERGEVGFVVLIAVVGIALLVAEVFFVSFGVLAVMSGTALIGAVFLAFQEGTAFGVTMLVAEAIAAPLALTGAFKLMPRTRLGKAIMLDAPRHEDVSAAAEDASLRGLLHKEGTTLSVLRPAGYARIEGRRIDVVTRGEMLDEGVPVRVIEVSANRVVVAASGPAASN